MIRYTFISLGVAAVLTAAYALGPRYEVNSHVGPAPDIIDAGKYVTSVERRIPDLIEGTEKTIVWAGEQGERTERVIVYVHGFSATRQEVAPLCDSLAARLDANLFYTRLKGHGRPGNAMAEATAGDWLFDVREALAIARALGDRVLLIGSSTGATLIVWAVSGALPVEETAVVDALVLMSPNFGPADARSGLLLMPWGQQLARMILGEYREWIPHTELQGRYWTTRYPTSAVFPMMGSVRAARAADPGRFRMPVLVAYSPHDQVVDTGRIVEWFDSIASDDRRLVQVADAGDPSGHILAGDILSPETTDRLVNEIAAFLNGL